MTHRQQLQYPLLCLFKRKKPHPLPPFLFSFFIFYLAFRFNVSHLSYRFPFNNQFFFCCQFEFEKNGHNFSHPVRTERVFEQQQQRKVTRVQSVALFYSLIVSQFVKRYRLIDLRSNRRSNGECLRWKVVFYLSLFIHSNSRRWRIFEILTCPRPIGICFQTIFEKTFQIPKHPSRSTLKQTLWILHQYRKPFIS